MKKVVKMMLGTMVVAGIFVSNVEAKENEDIGNNILKVGKIVAIEYSDNQESLDWKEYLDKMYFEIDGQIYLYYDFAEDMFAGDDVLVMMNTKGTEDMKDDIILDYRYYRPDLESQVGYYDMVENGSYIGSIDVSDIFDNEELQQHLYDLSKGVKEILDK